MHTYRTGTDLWGKNLICPWQLWRCSSIRLKQRKVCVLIRFCNCPWSSSGFAELTWRPRWCRMWRLHLLHGRWVARSERRCSWTRLWLWVCAVDLAAGRALWPELLTGRHSLDGEGVKEETKTEVGGRREEGDGREIEAERGQRCTFD